MGKKQRAKQRKKIRKALRRWEPALSGVAAALGGAVASAIEPFLEAVAERAHSQWPLERDEDARDARLARRDREGDRAQHAAS